MNYKLGEYIKISRIKKGLTLIQLSWKIGEKLGKPIDANYISRIESGIISRPDKERLKIIAENLEINLDELYRLADYHLEPLEDMVHVKFADMAAGHGVFENQAIYLPKSLIPTDKVIGYRVRGQSMEPDIPEDSIIIVDLENKPKKGQIVVAWICGQGFLKRLIEREVRMELIGKTGDPITVDDTVHIEGAVIFVGKFL